MENINELDPKWTAYALGELSEDELFECKNIIQDKPELQHEIEEIRRAAVLLEEFMKREPFPEHSTPSHPASVQTRSRGPAVRLFRITVAAAILLVVVGIVVSNRFSTVREAARRPDVNPEKLERDAEEFPSADIAPESVSTPIFARRSDSSASVPESSMAGSSEKSSGYGSGSSGMGGGMGGMGGNSGMSGGMGGMGGGMGMSAPQGTAYFETLSMQGMSTLDGPSTDSSGFMPERSRRGFEVQLGVAPVTPDSSRGREREILFDTYDASGSGRSPAITENVFLKPQDVPLSTFSIDVDTASYSAMRRAVRENRPVDPGAVRLEEFINYFQYDYPQPEGDKPFSTNVELGACPWEPKHLLAKIGLKGKEIVREERPALNLVFLIDVSGSMQGSNRLPLVQRGLTELVEMLEEKDRVAIVTYAGSSQIVLPSVSGRETRAILDSIQQLSAGGSTAGAAGIQSAYEVARKNFTRDGQNRVILCTDGDFNVGVTDNAQLETLIQNEAKSGVFLTVLGFGMGNYRDDKLKTLSSKGNGNYGYVDSLDEARKMLVDDLTGTLVTIAKDVKIQVDFNPARVAAYRLLGYEYRLLAARDFHDDRKDAGEIGAGHTVTALYEIVPTGETIPGEDRIDPSRYTAAATDEKTVQENAERDFETENPFRDELMFVKLRYKLPEETTSVLENFPVTYDGTSLADASPDFQFASAVALYGMLLRGSRYSGTGTFETVLESATSGADGPDAKARQEFLELVRQVKSRLSGS